MTYELSVLKRNGDVESFDINKIKIVLMEINNHIENNHKLSNVDELINELGEDFIHMIGEDKTISYEDINDFVWKFLLKKELYFMSKQYILYAEHKKEKYKKNEIKNKDKLNKDKLYVVKRDGNKEKFDINKIIEIYNIVSVGYKDKCQLNDFIDSVKTFLVDSIETKKIYDFMIKSCINNISTENINWNVLAGRIKSIQLYKESSIKRGLSDVGSKVYGGENYLNLVKTYVEKGLYDSRLLSEYSEKELKKAGKSLNKKRDFEYIYSTIHMLSNRYLLNRNKEIYELPQEMYMSIALFLALPEPKEKRLDIALEIYEYTSSQKISLPTPTLLNARTNEHQLSSCFITDVNDDLNDIYHNITDMARISKNAGGLGSYWGNVRAKGSSIRGMKGASGGVVPWLKVTNDTAISCNQLGSRMGAISTTLDIFHLDIFDFLDMQTETGDIRAKCFDIFPSVSIPDLFMERLEQDGEWTLFDPKEVEDKTGERLQDKFGMDFNVFYQSLERNESLELINKVKAKDLFKKLLKSVVETGMPYVFFRDTVNNLNPNKHCGNIYSSNLCTEIAQNMKPNKFISEKTSDGKVQLTYEMGDMVTCNLASINLGKVFESNEIKNTLRVITRILDNVIILNKFPVEEARDTAERYRSIGIGYMGLAELLAAKSLTYEDVNTLTYLDELFEEFAYYTMYYSNELSKERGAYPLFPGSEWSKGVLMGKDKDWFQKNKKTNLDWDVLIDDIVQDGVRFGYHSSPAPNTSTAGVVGTTAGLVPIYKKYFIETNAKGSVVNVAPNLNQDNFWYYKEYVNMRMTPVIDVISTIQKWIDQSISFEWIINPQNTGPLDLFNYYLHAWKKGIKTVYYVRSMSLEIESCESCAG